MMLAFLFRVVAISLSGVLAPGPITAATLAAGARHRHAGALITLGHMLVEFPLILLMTFGVANFLQSATSQAIIGFTGGAVLVAMGFQLLRSARQQTADSAASVQRHPLVTGIILSAANPYFLVWWATVGLTLTTQAWELGMVALLLFILVHWLCDLGWLEFLSLAGFKGSEIFGARAQCVVSIVCGIVLFAFGLNFLYDAGVSTYLLLAAHSTAP